MSHPAILDWENEDFHWIHLEHISNRKNIWYVGFGHLYSYHFLQSTYPTLSLDEWDISSNISNKINVGQNYPNPFNPTTNIEYELYKEEFVKVTVYDILGNTVKDLLKTNIQWYRFGRLYKKSDFDMPNDKQIQIGQFKAGFSSDLIANYRFIGF